MAYAYLAAAIILEVFGTVAMKYSEGFTKVVPSILTVACHGICFVSLTVALKSLPVSNVYAIWAGVGTALMAILGLIIFGEPLPLQKVLATGLIVLGVVMLNFSGPSQREKAEEQLARVELEKAQTAVAPVSNNRVAVTLDHNSG